MGALTHCFHDCWNHKKSLSFLRINRISCSRSTRAVAEAEAAAAAAPEAEAEAVAGAEEAEM